MSNVPEILRRGFLDRTPHAQILNGVLRSHPSDALYSGNAESAYLIYWSKCFKSHPLYSKFG